MNQAVLNLEGQLASWPFPILRAAITVDEARVSLYNAQRTLEAEAVTRAQHRLYNAKFALDVAIQGEYALEQSLEEELIDDSGYFDSTEPEYDQDTQDMLDWIAERNY